MDGTHITMWHAPGVGYLGNGVTTYTVPQNFLLGGRISEASVETLRIKLRKPAFQQETNSERRLVQIPSGRVLVLPVSGTYKRAKARFWPLIQVKHLSSGSIWLGSSYSARLCGIARSHGGSAPPLSHPPSASSFFLSVIRSLLSAPGRVSRERLGRRLLSLAPCLFSLSLVLCDLSLSLPLSLSLSLSLSFSQSLSGLSRFLSGFSRSPSDLSRSLSDLFDTRSLARLRHILGHLSTPPIYSSASSSYFRYMSDKILEP